MSSPELSTISEPELLAQAKAGDREAFEVLVARHQAAVYRLVFRLSGNEHDAEDILQETFLQVFRKLSTFRGEAQFTTWIYRVATNAALMHRRAQRRHAIESLEMYLPRFDATGHHVRLDVDYSAAARIEGLVEHRQLRRLIRDALDRLPSIYRVAFALNDLEDLPASEVASLLGIDPATVRQRVHRARLMLRGYLGRLAGGEDHA